MPLRLIISLWTDGTSDGINKALNADTAVKSVPCHDCRVPVGVTKSRNSAESAKFEISWLGARRAKLLNISNGWRNSAISDLLTHVQFDRAKPRARRLCFGRVAEKPLCPLFAPGSDDAVISFRGDPSLDPVEADHVQSPLQLVCFVQEPLSRFLSIHAQQFPVAGRHPLARQQVTQTGRAGVLERSRTTLRLTPTSWHARRSLST